MSTSPFPWFRDQDPATLGPVMTPPPSPVWAKPEIPTEQTPSTGMIPEAPKMDLHANLPKVFAAPEPTPLEGNIANDTSELAKVRHSEATPWGTPENHPGFLGKTAHVLSEIGNVAGDILAPGVMANIPGSQSNMQLKEEGLAHRLNEEEKEQSENTYRGAEQAKDEAETPEVAPNAESTRGVQGATTRHLDAETHGLENPTRRDYEVHDTAQGPMIINKKTGIPANISALTEFRLVHSGQN